MKRIKILTLLLLVTVACGLAVHAEEMPIASFDKTIVDFGVFKEDNAKQHAEFTIKNTGTAPLIIVKARATCGCTTPTYTKAPIMPGKTGKIAVEYNGKNRAPGPFNKSIFVTTNASKDQIRLQIKGNMHSSPKR